MQYAKWEGLYKRNGFKRKYKIEERRETFEINTEELPMGIYFLQLLSGGYGRTKKFVKI